MLDFINHIPVGAHDAKSCEEDSWEETVVYEVTNPDLVILPRPPVAYHYELVPNRYHYYAQ